MENFQLPVSCVPSGYFGNSMKASAAIPPLPPLVHEELCLAVGDQGSNDPLLEQLIPRPPLGLEQAGDLLGQYDRGALVTAGGPRRVSRRGCDTDRGVGLWSSCLQRYRSRVPNVRREEDAWKRPKPGRTMTHHPHLDI